MPRKRAPIRVSTGVGECLFCGDPYVFDRFLVHIPDPVACETCIDVARWVRGHRVRAAEAERAASRQTRRVDHLRLLLAQSISRERLVAEVARKYRDRVPTRYADELLLTLVDRGDQPWTDEKHDPLIEEEDRLAIARALEMETVK